MVQHFGFLVHHKAGKRKLLYQNTAKNGEKDHATIEKPFVRDLQTGRNQGQNVVVMHWIKYLKLPHKVTPGSLSSRTDVTRICHCKTNQPNVLRNLLHHGKELGHSQLFQTTNQISIPPNYEFFFE